MLHVYMCIGVWRAIQRTVMAKDGDGIFGETPVLDWLHGTVRLNNINLPPWHGKNP